MAEPQNDPLLPGYSFNAHLVAGLTPIEAEGYLDFYVDRPLGMKGYILNLTVRGEGVVKNGDQQFICRPGDMLLFPPGEIHHYGRHPDAKEWYHQWVYFRPRAYWQEWLSWPAIFAHTGLYRPDEAHLAQFRELFAQIIEAGQAGATPNCWPSTCLNRCCCAAWRPSTSRLIRRWTTASATPASTSATTLPTASLILPASPSMCVCRRHGSLICSASSLA